MHLARNKKDGRIGVVPDGYQVSTGWESLGYGWIYWEGSNESAPPLSGKTLIEAISTQGIKCGPVFSGKLEWRGKGSMAVRYYRKVPDPIPLTEAEPEADENDEEVFTPEEVTGGVPKEFTLIEKESK